LNNVPFKTIRIRRFYQLIHPQLLVIPLAVAGIRDKESWSRYATRLILNVQKSVRKLYDISRLRFLLYPSRLTPADIVRIKKDDIGVIWLDKK